MKYAAIKKEVNFFAKALFIERKYQRKPVRISVLYGKARPIGLP
jgi:hypothetical protein